MKKIKSCCNLIFYSFLIIASLITIFLIWNIFTKYNKLHILSDEVNLNLGNISSKQVDIKNANNINKILNSSSTQEFYSDVIDPFDGLKIILEEENEE